MARNAADRSMDHASSVKSNCVPKSGEQSKDLQDGPKGDAPQNQVEYGAGDNRRPVLAEWLLH